MPMYFPDLRSVQQLAKDMARNEEGKKYTGIFPKTEEELSEARRQLGKYLRDIWHDNVFAMEVELGVSEENYEAKMRSRILFEMFGK